MKKTKFTTLGIICFLLFLLLFNFIPQNQKSSLKHTPAPKSQESSQESQSPQESQNLSQNNADLIQKNIDFIRQNLESLKENNQTQSLTSNESNLTQEQFLDSNTTQGEIAQIPTQEPPQMQESSQNLQETLQSPQEDLSPDFSHNQMPQTSPQIPSQTFFNCQRHKPQLAIIIDDISTLEQLKKIQKIPLKLTPSIFPLSKATPSAKQIAEATPFFMIHLPLEAIKFYQKGYDWLLVSDSKEKIKEKVAKVKRDFPNLTYLNNHTGSKFTQNYKAMSYLLDALNQHQITFVDSKTIHTSKTASYFENNPTASLNPCQKPPFLVRDIFLDNELNVFKITQALLQSIKIAKLQGYAIAIGHPHKETILALMNAREYLEKSGVEVVYVNELIVP